MRRLFHVSSVLNRASITTHGLDWTRMGAAPGIAGSRWPEVDGCFLCDDDTVDWFATTINNTGGPVDVWAVDGVDTDLMVETGNGFLYLPERIPTDRLSLIREDIPAPVWPED